MVSRLRTNALKIATFSLIFVVFAAIFNFFNQFEHWDWGSFLLGIACGLPILTCYLMSNKVGLLLFLIGAAGLSMIAFGGIRELVVNHQFFSGMSIGVMFGLFPSLLLVRREALLFLVRTANLDGYHSLACWIEHRFLREGPKR